MFQIKKNARIVISSFLYDLLQIRVFENHRKSRIQHCERSELRLHFEWSNATYLVIFKHCDLVSYLMKVLTSIISKYGTWEKVF